MWEGCAVEKVLSAFMESAQKPGSVMPTMISNPAVLLVFGLSHSSWPVTTHSMWILKKAIFITATQVWWMQNSCENWGDRLQSKFRVYRSASTYLFGLMLGNDCSSLSLSNLPCLCTTFIIMRIGSNHMALVMYYPSKTEQIIVSRCTVENED